MRLTRPSTRTLLTALMLITGGGGLLLFWQSAWGEWASTRPVGTFHLRSELPLDDAEGQALLQEMARIRAEVARQLQLPANGRPLEVNLFATRESFQRYVAGYFPDAAARTALYVHDADAGRVILYQHDNFETDLRHECTHAVLHNTLKQLPLWLDEGLAEYFEIPAGERVRGNPYLEETKRQIAAGWKPDLSRLEELANLAEMTGEDYRESWAWAHFLLHASDSTRQLLHDFLMESQSGLPVGRLSDKLKSCYANPDAELLTHFQDW
ncbi:hypothetical protein [Planctomicrobium piriforme]|uniref:DUF1570 domain-containing protein n=1 Tax=Planctomicrobium piriforme TaxID=1576369 RepID=A0A1I3GNH0_9PLAN|nr:hypothetical protein [Planctomicrobium piriforme]SFI24980.1 hypothetical protein SAMN05421753_10767 [Planctomicrobium piriforme]